MRALIKESPLSLPALLPLHQPPNCFPKKVRKELPYARIGNVVYAEVGEKKLLLDIYKPKNETGLTPVVIWIHGGGWTQGTKSGGIPFAKMLTPHGISVV